MKLPPQRIGLWDQYGGSMPAGQTRWLFEQFEFPYTILYPQDLDAGNLRQKFDVIVFVTGAIPGTSGGGGRGGRGGGGRGGAAEIPAEFQHMTGRVSVEQTVPQLKTFMEQGGTVITIGSSTNLAEDLGLPIKNYLVERSPTGEEESLPREKFYIPGSVMQVTVDNSLPIAAGLPKNVDVFFENSPVFRLEPNAALKGVRPIAWYATSHTLRSGWAWGQNYLEGGTSMAEADVGKGKLFLFGPEILFRAQPAGHVQVLLQRDLRGERRKRRPHATHPVGDRSRP